RGKALSLYMIVQMAGIVAGQGLLLVADPGGYVLFMVISILVSISFAPILLSISPTPAFQRTNPMTLRQLYVSSPLGCVGMFLLGGVFSSQFGMAAVFSAAADLRLGQISAFVAAFYVGAMVLQYPIGWFSDRMDRRVLISIVSAMGALAALVGIFGWFSFPVLLGAAFLIGGMSNPLYSLLIAHTNDFLDYEDMVAASSGLLFINGLGAISGPLIVGWVMDRFGPSGFFLVIGTLMGGLTIYALYRMTQRASVAVEDTGVYAAVAPSASPVALKIAQDYAVDIAGEEEEG
ncbi:MAG: MFS transporter, partial [Paracoccaceae bacterium]